MSDVPAFLGLARWQLGDTVFEVASRRRLDTRQMVPYFVRGGVLHAGVLDRERASRSVRGESLRGLEPIGFDFAGVDETADILHYGEAIFATRTHVEIDDTARKIALPSLARSIGYLTELSLPLALGIRDPGVDALDVAWDGETHTIRFAPVDAWLDALDAPDAPRHTEDLRILLRALTGPAPSRTRAPDEQATSASWLATHAHRIVRTAGLAAAVEQRHPVPGARRLETPSVDALRFLAFRSIDHRGARFEVVTPGTGVSLAMLPIVSAGAERYALLWREPRVTVLERHARQPLYDAPLQPHHLNATATYVTADEARELASAPAIPLLERIVTRHLSRAFDGDIGVRSLRRIGPALETCPSTSSELRHRVWCEIDPRNLTLPPDALLVPLRDLSRAVAWGRVRDPVIVAALAETGHAFGVDPFADVRQGDVSRRHVFVSTMTKGSLVQRRLQRYSSIEREQLGAPTYARLMTLLQHEYGVRVAYPRDESDRTFFKAAFRVFMAADREENRALQGLHWSHDAFHFALGNFTPPAEGDLGAWYPSDAPPPPESPPEGARWEAYASALKSAEDEATFFSFWTLYREQPSLARHVGKLTFHRALCDMGIDERDAARGIFDAVTTRAELPEAVARHPLYAARDDVRGLFAYMLGFREYHLKDIRAAWKYAARDPYRALFVRFGLYESDASRYVASVRAFQARLDAYPPGLNPLLAAAGDARVSLCLRVWDIVKALRMVRTASAVPAVRASMWSIADEACSRLDSLAREWTRVRAEITNAEITPWNERVYGELSALVMQVEASRDALWDSVATLGVLDDSAIAAERARELPR